MAKPKYDVVAIGSATRDAFFKGDFKIIRYAAAPSGRALVFPFGEKLEVKKAYFTIGGNGANTSVTFARQGFRTGIASSVGNDVSGEEIRRRLRRESINTANIIMTAHPPADMKMRFSTPRIISRSIFQNHLMPRRC